MSINYHLYGETQYKTTPSNGSEWYGKNVNAGYNRRNEAPKSKDMECVQRPSKATSLWINDISIKSGGLRLKASRVGVRRNAQTVGSPMEGMMIWSIFNGLNDSNP